MRNMMKKSALAIAVAASLGLVACVDKDDSDKANVAPVNKTTSGVITRFGSVYINGVKYETDGADVVIDGVASDESLLKLGMVVSLSGTDLGNGTGNAMTIDFEDEVEGVVLNVSNYPVDGTLNIMGLTIQTDGDTVFESIDDSMLTIADVEEGNIIEVSGYALDNGVVFATRLEVKKTRLVSGDKIEVKGHIASPITDTTFMIGDLTVDYSSAVFEDMTADMIAENLLVEVKSNTGFGDTNELLATKIELKSNGKRDYQYDNDDEEVEVEGIISDVVSNTEIKVNGVTVLLDSSTRLVHGNEATLAVGLKVKLEGRIDDNGILVANKLVFKPSGDVEMNGEIESIDIANKSITLFGLTVTLDNSTMVKDDRDDVDESELIKYQFGVDDLAVGDWVEIKAFKNASGGLTATKAERETREAGERAELEGKISAVDAVMFTMVVAGIDVDYSSQAILSPEVGMKADLKGSFLEGVFTVSSGKIKQYDEFYIDGSREYEDDRRGHDDKDHDDDDKDGDDDKDHDDKDRDDDDKDHDD